MLKDLEAILMATPRPSMAAGSSARQACVIEFFNDCPPSYNTRIINIGGKIFFQGPGGVIVDEQVVSKVTDITSGGKDHITSQEGCARIVHYACTVEYDGQTQVLQGTAQVSEQECINYLPLHVAPKSTTSRGAGECPLELISRLAR